MLLKLVSSREIQLGEGSSVGPSPIVVFFYGKKITIWDVVEFFQELFGR
jgi:hypothetical protein